MDTKAGDNGKLAALRKKEAELKAKIAAIEAQENAKRRKEDTRVKVLIGAAFVTDIEKNPDTRADVLKVIDRAITAEKDRAFLKSQGWL